jgi:abhydrolase domain-containing protein 12
MQRFVKMPLAQAAWKLLLGIIAGILGLYFAFIFLLTVPRLQDHAIYLHKITLTWFQDVNVPELWGFLRNQVTPFQLKTPDGETLHAWHILPLDTYREYESKLREEPTGLAENIEERLSLKLLKDDENARLVIYFHGAAGTLGSGWRPQSYRALSAIVPNLHILAIDYRGFGSSTGWPSESGILMDALTLVNFATNTAGVPPERIALFAQSLGTAVALSLSHKLALENPPTLFAGMVLVAPMADVETATQTYKIAGVIPLLSPMAFFPPFLEFFNKFIVSKWPSKATIAAFVRHLETMEQIESRKHYDITLIHAEDDWDMPWGHSDILFAHAVRAMTRNSTLSEDEFHNEEERRKVSLGNGGWEVKWSGKHGLIREQIVKHGLHDRIMSYPVVSLAIAKTFDNTRIKDM